MSISNVTTLIDALRTNGLVQPEELEEITYQSRTRCTEPRSLAKFLVQRGWLTVYQMNQLLLGQGHELALGPYRVLDQIGQGGISQVFKAWSVQKGCVVALKVLRSGLMNDNAAVRQFQREVDAVTRLAHPNIITTLDAGQLRGRHFFAMEHIEGNDLGKVVQLSGPLPQAVACDYIRQAAMALQHAHERGVVHRDIKPANLFLVNSRGTTSLMGVASNQQNRSGGEVLKILDWGLARLSTAVEEIPSTHGCSDWIQEGMVIGTPDYLSPEQAQNARQVDIRADVYSLGCTLYYLLAGQPPFPGNSLVHKLLQHAQAEPTPLTSLRSDLQPGLITLLARMMAKRPEDRCTPAAVALSLVSLRRTGRSTSDTPLPKSLPAVLRERTTTGPIADTVTASTKPPPGGAQPPTESEISIPGTAPKGAVQRDQPQTGKEAVP
jgi:serine/threonine protein kinase